MKHNFKDSLTKGNKGQDLFLDTFKLELKQLDGKSGDFLYLPTNKKIELKTDYYDPSKTSNFFFERFSYTDRPGGPWQALEHGCDYFIYLFIQTGQYYVFEMTHLIEQLNPIIEVLKPCKIYNIGHTTIGYKVPRDCIQNLSEGFLKLDKTLNLP